jgi:glycosyltransferase involved in cell wall biosynthesis
LTGLSAHKRLLLIVNDAGFFVSHRLPVALAARDAGFDVHVATGPGEAAAIIRSHGIAHHPLRLSRSGTNPLGEVLAFLQIARMLQRLRPDLVHLVTVKPVLYGGIAARLTGVPAVVAAISGLGDVFAAHNLRTRTVRRLVILAYRVALNRDRLKVIFQNASDRDTLSRMAGLTRDKAVMVRGSGVDLRTYHPAPEPEGVPVVTFASRLLRSKGVYEFVAAAQQLNACGVHARFQLVGDVDPGNASSVSAAEIGRWRGGGAVEVLGYRQDMARIFAASNLIVLPSYYGEGLPRVLLEAAACGRAIVTTDMPGCRDAVEPGITALLVPPRDATALANAIHTLLTDPARRHTMGSAARALAEREYAIEHIVAQHLKVYRDLVGGDAIADLAR